MIILAAFKALFKKYSPFSSILLKTKGDLMKKIFLAFMLLGCGVLFAKPVVYIVATGGTIAGAASSSTASQYSPSKVLIDTILKALPADELAKYAELKTDQLMQISSQNLSTDNWLKLSKRVNELLAKKEVSGLVITHGTDTLEETAQFLQLTVHSNKPVVVVGAMRPSTSLSADGPKNLWDAIVLAASKEAIGKGVMVEMNGVILSGGDVIKSNPTALTTFIPANIGVLGHMWENKPYFLRDVSQKHTKLSEFDIMNTKKLPRVDIFYGFAGMQGDVIDAAVKDGTKGIVMAGVGNGNFSESVEKSLIKASKKGVVVVRSVRMNHGSTTQWAEVDDKKYKFAAAWWHTPQQARIILMLALNKGLGVKDIEKIQALMLEY